MNIIIDNSIRTQRHPGFFRGMSDTKEITVHATGGGSSAGALIAWLLTPGQRKKKADGLFHYCIDYNGDVYELIDPVEKWVYHSSTGKRDRATIGIEIMKKDVRNESEPTIQQYRSLLQLINTLLENIDTINIICGHGRRKKRYGLNYKNCPGKFDWNIITDELISEGHKFKYESEYIFEIERSDEKNNTDS